MIELWVDEPSGKSGFLGLFAFAEIGEAAVYLFNPTSDDPDGPDPDVEIVITFEENGDVRLTDHKQRYFDGQTFTRVTLLPAKEDE